MNSLELHQLVNQIQLNQLTSFGKHDFDPTDREHISYLQNMVGMSKLVAFLKRYEFDLGRTTTHHERT